MNDHTVASKVSQILGFEKEIDWHLKEAARLTHRVKKLREEVGDGGILASDTRIHELRH